jgi:hypothetical protein
MSITKQLYDEYAEKSFFTEKNFSGRYSPSSISANMIPYEKLQEFHYQTSFFLNFYASLYIELKKHENSNTYNITTFANTIENLGIIIDNTNKHSSDGGSINKLSNFSSNALINSNYDFTFYVKTFEAKTSNHDELYTHGSSLSSNVAYLTSSYSNILSNSKPIFGTNQTTLTISSSYSSNLILKSNTPTNSYLLTTDILNKTNSLSSILENNKIIKNINTTKFKEIIEEILSQTPENILGYLLYKKIYYNIILYNISIQNAIRKNYLNYENANNILNLASNTIDNYTNSATYSCSSVIACENYIAIFNFIVDSTTNITTLNDIHFKNTTDNDYLMEKNKYRNKISTLNSLRDEYTKIQDKLNISTKLYNQQYKNYNSIKKYATYVIIALIIIIVSIIIISLFPIFSNETKHAIYIILLIVLIVITFLYYTNFKYVNLYEKFAATGALGNLSIVSSQIITFTNGSALHKTNHAKFYNKLLPAINAYSNAYNDLLNNMRLNINTIGSKTFSQDSNIYLYNLYLEKKRQIEQNNIKLTNLFNMIEIIKKQINYLFNIIFFISCFTIILLISLVIYSTVPHLYIFVIVLCVVLITILMIYFTFAIIQPTRMIANKNYWAIANPSKNNMGKL